MQGTVPRSLSGSRKDESTTSSWVRCQPKGVPGRVRLPRPSPRPSSHFSPLRRRHVLYILNMGCWVKLPMTQWGPSPLGGRAAFNRFERVICQICNKFVKPNAITREGWSGPQFHHVGAYLSEGVRVDRPFLP